MNAPHHKRARWTLTALATALAGGAMIGWFLRDDPITAAVAGVLVTSMIIICAETVRRRINRTASQETDRTGEVSNSIDAHWKRIADEWRRRYL